MALPYNKVNWVDGVTPENAATLGQMDQGIDDLDNARGQANGIATLGADGKVPVAQLPAMGADLSYDGDWAAPTTYQDGDVVVKDGVAYLCVGGPTTTPPDPVPWGAAALAKTGYGTSLPASPVDGQEHVLVDSLTNPSYQWRFRYNAGSTSAYKWEFIGGTFPIIIVGTTESPPAAGWTNLPTNGPMFTLPRAGDYTVEASSTVLVGATVPNAGWCGVAVGDTDPEIQQPVYLVGAGYSGHTWVRGQFFGRPAGTLLKHRYTANALDLTFSNRQLMVTPRRVA